ncbi:MAG TPA: ATP-binding cassette domain-containing protein [Phycicoccus elongatus]|uniref:energy-coupling factor ABC transporter ATP-binding protein n=1 Tax=Phycicoccus TaxID=367298 RepID=UPI002584E33D|nr:MULTISPECIES: ATP-binding cassette domain-containing protein [Phycicoccus]MCO5302099.1 ATP-binding cassette domain-containing protein [Phycicoccus sp.]HPF76447.1 ATP-binding cassette domain-containing protein [Phycicoccus elongatus]HPK12441.1 ATP-binding cassette domain-containing protein [Phycicoccus elongatus]HPQ73902.1 ATP-binding cassette domain-containing protein [Phycicoccus elongatus]HRV57597.1 ATP-binding cassette domain-containing protein [Phycicoccus sp.]
MTHRTGTWEPTEGAVLVGEGLHAGYPGRADVLDCAHIAVSSGSRLALLGENGSGKTTLLRCLSGAHEPTAGRVVVDGIALSHSASGLREHRQRVQLVLQDPDDQLFSADVRADVSFGPINLGLDDAEVRVRVAEALELLDVTELADRPVHQLSYGQRKRVAIAGAVAMRPQVLLLDEPTAGLDPRAVTTLRAALSNLEARGTTVVVSTHDIDFAWEWADEVGVVVDGIVHQGSTVKIMTDEALLGRAHLGVPWPVRLLRSLGHEIDVVAPPRTVSDVARLLG